ncbi:MAG: glycosyl transferase family 2 [Thermoplasmata archaeon M9B1D]|nr:MAG: glycosyl transferase family 2 [Thermoplasmata archaeon M9B1D]
MFISIIITIKNEAKTIQPLLDSLLDQQQPFEIIIIDANSSDDTQKIIKKYMQNHSNIKLYIKAGSRGNGRNYGVTKAKGEIVAFTDGGCTAEKNWLENIRKKMSEGYDIVAGKTINTGSFKETKRVEIIQNGYDITWPSCNLAYKKQLFEKINGFDEQFITAEDIDLNFKAVKTGAKIGYAEKAIIYRSSASSLYKFIQQSFWYGYGRKQLSLKHGTIWKNYSANQMMQTQLTLHGVLRLVFGFFGYISCKNQKNLKITNSIK